ncbi:MAG: hypothetical protein HY673_12615 [Chloroflexi bacterium]|nr:hypothetical protein [Chloroflexota bacterium]
MTNGPERGCPGTPGRARRGRLVTGIAILLIATLINALLAKYVVPLLRRTSRPAGAAAFGVLMEAAAMVLILLLAPPFYQAVEVVKVIAFRMMVANAASVAVFSSMVRNLVKETFL